MSEASKKVSDAIKPILIEALNKQAYAALLSIPGLGWVFGLPIVSHMTKFFIDRITSWAVQETAVGLSKVWIQWAMGQEIKSAEEAREKLRDILDNPNKYVEKEQKEIDEYFDETTLDLIQLGIKRL